MRQRNSRMMEIMIAFFLFSGYMQNYLAYADPGEVINNHSQDLRNIFDKFDAIITLEKNGLVVPEREFRNPVICVRSVEELNEIENALVRNATTLYDSKDVRIKVSTNCTEIDTLKTGILKLKDDFKILINEKISSRIYKNLKADYEEKNVQFQNQLSETRKIAFKDELEIVDKLENEFNLHQKHISDILQQLEEEQKSLNDANVQLAISFGRKGQLDEALAVFANITDHEIRIERIVIEVYAINDDNFENIFHFIGRIPRLPTRINGYKALYEELKKNNYVNNANIWILAAELEKITEPTDGLVEAVIDDVTRITRRNYFDGIVEFVNERGPDGLHAVTHFAPLFIRLLYEESGNSIEKVLNIFRKFTFVRHRLYLINELIIMLKADNNMRGKEMTLIVFELIKIRSADKEESEEDKSFQDIIEQNLPDELRDLMYNNLCIQNAENDEFLFAGVPADKDRRHIYTAKTLTLDDSFYWHVYFVANGTKVLIKNIRYQEHLYLMDEGHEDEVHVLRSWIPDPMEGNRQAEFTLDMIGNGQFLIINTLYEQLLYSPFDGVKNENNNRPIFSKKYDTTEDISIDSKWKMGICRLDVEYVF